MTAKRCIKCHVGESHAAWKGGRSKTSNGYISVVAKKDEPGQTKKGYILEHRRVMQEHLGRALLPNENIHHINGVRDDNRIENLELWVKSQPPGQRVDQIVQWAKEILAFYEKP